MSNDNEMYYFNPELDSRAAATRTRGPLPGEVDACYASEHRKAKQRQQDDERLNAIASKRAKERAQAWCTFGIVVWFLVLVLVVGIIHAVWGPRAQ